MLKKKININDVNESKINMNQKIQRNNLKINLNK